MEQQTKQVRWQEDVTIDVFNKRVVNNRLSPGSYGGKANGKYRSRIGSHRSAFGDEFDVMV